LAPDRFNYDVLNHTDLTRDGGLSGDIDLSHVNWGNYDLVVIDESHNFRNKAANKGRETRYDRLMRKIIREGVRTRVLMLSATPVNNRLADLKIRLRSLPRAMILPCSTMVFQASTAPPGVLKRLSIAG
jgi:SNF2 family DNA or RNA helicase